VKAVTVELPDKLAQELDAVVEAGWFSDEGEAVRLALREFLRRQRRELEERFQREDIAWALKAKEAAG
jgi:Arc/MetJ-type ribon-helix-helix transcriptional regulator